MSEGKYSTPRRAARVRPGPLQVHLQSGTTGTLIDLSELGGLLDLPVPATVGTNLPFHLDCEGVPVTLQGRVVRSVPWYDVHARVTWMEPHSYRVAVEFFDVADHSALALRDLVHKAKGANA